MSRSGARRYMGTARHVSPVEDQGARALPGGDRNVQKRRLRVLSPPTQAPEQVHQMPRAARQLRTGVERARDWAQTPHGRIWVDAADFAVVRLEGEPAKNPSFWTKDSKIEQTYSKVNDFWLPAFNRSASAIRLGGHASFSIEYKDYQITAATPLTKSNRTIAGR